MDNAAVQKRRIGAYAFAILELTLYLDTHPQSLCALPKLNELQARRRQLIEEYEAQYGPLVMTSNHESTNSWTWIDGPWPWECRGGN